MQPDVLIGDRPRRTSIPVFSQIPVFGRSPVFGHWPQKEVVLVVDVSFPEDMSVWQARSGQELPKVLLGPALLYPSTPSGQATPETASNPLQEWPARRAVGLWPSSTPLDSPCCTPLPEDVYFLG
jgi:hypothetical protein